MTLWTSAEAAKATGGIAQGNWTASGVSIDTRTIETGDLFVALKDARDGHDFVAIALAAGAAAALVSRVPQDVAPDAPLLIAQDVQAGLEALGVAGRARSLAKIVAVTGSVGKTSTKDMLARILTDQGRTHAPVASYNNHWGVPLTLARMPRDTEYAIIEIGMNHPGEIAPLACMAHPHVALITTVAAAHLEAFENVAAIAREKASVLDGLEPGGVAVLNTDIAQAHILTGHATSLNLRTVSFGENATDFCLTKASQQGNVMVVQAFAQGEALLFKIQSAGQHFAMNGLGALAACEALGADLALATHSLGHWKPFRGRGAREVICLDPVETDRTLELIDDSYNANPASMAAALDVLANASPKKGRRIAFVGDMKELGSDEVSLHADLAELPAMAAIDQVYCIGPLMQALCDALPEAKQGGKSDSSAEMVQGIRSRIDAGDVVLVKGSLSMKLGLIVDAIRKMGHGGTGANTQDNE
jgi:UDP-N-acetylmuramoyl-tripeptide--D-alanyl-D-alanine ligase